MPPGWVSYGVLLLFLLTVIKISAIPGKSIVRGMKPLVMILDFHRRAESFFQQGRQGAGGFLGYYHHHRRRGACGLLMLVRILMLVTATFLLTYTTSPIALTDGLESLMNPLKVIKVPVHELSMMMCIALRFIPTLIEETDKIMSAQKARGADFESGKLMRAGKGADPHSGAAVHQCVPPCGRAGHGHGVPLLPGRRGANQDEAAALSA